MGGLFLPERCLRVRLAPAHQLHRGDWGTFCEGVKAVPQLHCEKPGPAVARSSRACENRASVKSWKIGRIRLV